MPDRLAPKNDARSTAVQRDDYDSPWKEVLDRWHRQFIEFFFPRAAADIEWSRGYEFLDKELQKVTRRAVVGRRHVDKLIKVWRRSGDETWVLIHTEIQGNREGSFARRLYSYHSRLMDRYNRPVATLVVLADDYPEWRPDHYEHELWGCRALLEFPCVKLLDYRDRLTELEVSENPFALVVLAQLAATATRRDPSARLERKIGLTRRLYRRGLEREDILSLYAFIDWVLALPDALEEDYHRYIQTIEEAAHMQYVTTAERIGIQKGRQEGRQEAQRELLEQLLMGRFGSLPASAVARLAGADSAQLAIWFQRGVTASTLDAVFGPE
ncbi:cytosolic protein [uncultured Thiodictyon sp.]|uniref:cytosolic protein n=1 Tax=uncultured Thiodictyon sp. TaxID=1846217 RepID=UPI0025CD92BD|nr:cytosolic protein [uncultured Thiodictyon sp.]